MGEQLYLTSRQAVCVLQPHITVKGDSSFYYLKNHSENLLDIRKPAFYFSSVRV